ncbi:hypothetical protein GLOIN_2v1776429 [Rhizophagus clarus]|uniref:BAH domain-containing protein n=1 Tax=Rhizophagus clarus TaxID=94130 RepID=A0A8H3L7Z0_9GLOM|nr:hypothetical protein GLOIN_2v1776429 [Rhizophagus clarus]
MLRNKPRKANIATLPFCICNNFRRLPNRFLLSDNDDNEKMVQKDFEDDNISGEDDDDHIEQRSDNEQRSNNEEGDTNMISTSSENETESDYIMSLESDEEYETMSSDNEERHDSDISEEKLFVDEALAKDKLPSYDSDFAPYFQNLTTAALFCWIYKHNISTNAYEDLVDIIMRPEFNRDHIVKNIRRFRAWRERLPLPSISAKSISISSKKIPSTLKDSKMAYQLSISDIIWNVLNNPLLLKEMYFGAGVDSKTKSEYWYGTLWAESPLFGQEQLMISGEIYQCGDFVYYYDNERKLGRLRAILLNEENQQYRLRIQKVLDYSDLPGTFKEELRQTLQKP